MKIIEHKKEIRESILKFIKEMEKEHGVNIITTKDFLISEVFDSAYEVAKECK